MPHIFGANIVTMLTLQKLFSPDGQKFYRLFEEVSANLKQASESFYTAIHTPDVLPEHLKKLDQLEHANDILTHKLFVELGRNFITPFDREDIHYLTVALDDIADLSYGVIRQMKSYGIKDAGNTTMYVAAEFRRLVTLLDKVLNGLRDKRQLAKLDNECVEMKKIILTCDTRVDAAITGLFPTQDDVVQIIKWMEHYELLHALLEKCENALHTIETIIIKYS